MPGTIYRQQLADRSAPIDLGFWRKPEGIPVPDDELQFLLVPDRVEAAAIADVAAQVHRYQARHADSPELITQALIVTMGGLLPGALLYDHLVHGRAGPAAMAFGTVGVSLYKGPGERYENPRVQHDLSIPVEGKTVLLIDDLGDTGGTLKFLDSYLEQRGAHQALNLVLYMKPAARTNFRADFCFGEAAQDTWIITPRELVETLVKRVPIWRARGASEAECRRRLVDLIGYPESIVDQYLPGAFAAES